MEHLEPALLASPLPCVSPLMGAHVRCTIHALLLLHQPEHVPEERSLYNADQACQSTL
jgi:hypothetical protein